MGTDAIGRLAGAFATSAALVAGSYAVPGLEAARPWTPGDPLPVVSKLMPRADVALVEDEATGAVTEVALAVVTPPPAPVEAVAEATALAGTAPLSAAALPQRPPGVPTVLEDPDFRGMDNFFRALEKAEKGAGVARALHYGDSTIAADGITSTVRKRLQEAHGNAGPGFVVAGMDPRWNMRQDVSVSREGEWTTATILNMGGQGRYGLGGIVSVAADGASVSFRYPREKVENPPALKHLEVWYQLKAGAGAWWAAANGKRVGGGSASGATSDQRLVVDIAEGYNRVSLGASGGAATYYGVVMETGTPGVTWEAMGVVGVGSKSFHAFNRAHIAQQVKDRDPNLIVVMLGGNETGYPSLQSGDGSAYLESYQTALRLLRAGAPDRSCLLLTPLDQGTRDASGAIKSKAAMPRLVNALRMAAQAEGCAFWNSWGAMGGEGSIGRWKAKGLAWTDLIHLSGPGLEIIGNLLSDAIEQSFAAWKAAGGSARPAPPPPGPPAS